jgi:subtilisin family serine protease
VCPPTPAWEQAPAKIIRELAQYFRDHDVRVVNMSFGDSPGEIEHALEQYGNEHDSMRRKEQARQAFEIEKRTMFEAISGSPEILFVAAAGNSNENTSDAEGIPGGFKLQNLITVGAVDPVGNAASFTHFGPTVSIYALGFEKARLLGGRETFFVGTSVAAPAVVNLAAKLLSVQPSPHSPTAH